MSDLGKKLKEARETQELSISEISLSTKIGARMIKALEDGNHKVLPALPFAKGFVRSYSAYLKLDQDEMVRLFLEEKGEGLAPVPIVEEIEEKEVLSNGSASVNGLGTGSSFSRFIILGGVLVLILTIVGVKSLVEKYKREGEVSEISETAVIPIQKEDASAQTPASEGADKENAVLIPKEEPKVEASKEPSKEGKIVSAEAVAPVQPPPSVPVEEPPKPEPVVAQASAEPPPVEIKEDVGANTPAAPQREVLIEALDKVRVTIHLGGKKQVLNLEAGEIHLLRSSESVVLDISDGGAINLVVNGRSQGVPGSLGQAKKVRFP